MDPKAAVPFIGRKGARAPNGPTMRTIYNVETGQEVVTKAVNAAEAVAGGHWTYIAPAGAEGSAGSVSDTTPTRAERETALEALKKDELVVLAGELAQPSDTKAVLVKKILDREFPET